MHILYLASSLHRYPGVRRKVFAQCEALQYCNNKVSLLTWDIDSFPPFETNIIPEIEGNFIELQYRKTINPINPFIRRWKPFIRANKIIRGHGVDLVYLRYPLADPFVTYWVSNCSVPVFSEYQSIVTNELKFGSSKIALWSELFFGNLLVKYLAGIVGVTQEITSFQKGKAINVPSVTIGNGIDITNFQVRDFLKFDDELRLLCIANFAPWHGVDRLIKGISEYKGETNIILNIVGEGSVIPELKDLTSKLGLEDKVIFHGFKSGKELDKLFNESHIAVGSLGIHRIGLKEASILKAREYCARGIPFISAFNDPDFREDFPYIKRFPADESPIDINMVVDFAKRVLSDDNYSINMNNYAKEYLDWSIKMKKLSDFLKELSCNENS
jgi:glycosyltransferase involved in cell wall biosynthesis